jgi:hypothetical protein
MISATITVTRKRGLQEYEYQYDEMIRSVIMEEFHGPNGAKLLAQATGLSYRTTEKYVSGERIPNGARMALICAASRTLTERIWKFAADVRAELNT